MDYQHKPNTTYEMQFDPNLLSNKEEELGIYYSDNDTALDLMKKQEKMIISELTLKYQKAKMYKNTTELNALIYSDKKFKDFIQEFEKVLKERNRSKIRYESFRSFRNDLRTKVVTERELAKHL